MLNRQGRVLKDCLFEALCTDIPLNKLNAAFTMDYYSYCILIRVLAPSPDLTWLEGLKINGTWDSLLVVVAYMTYDPIAQTEGP